MSSDSPELADLLAAISRSDRQAFKMLYDQTSAKLYGVILRIVRSRELADEVMQETYLRVWQKAGSYAAEAGRPMTWLIAVARYASIDLIRRRTESRSANVGDEDRVKNIPAPDDPERDVMIQQQLLRCLGRLAEPQREAVLLAYCSGYSREELATHFNAPVPTIKTWLHRSMITLRLCLDAP